MPFKLPRMANAGFIKQAEPDSPDFDIIVAGSGRTGVVSGCAVSAQPTPNLTVAVAAGSYEIAGVAVTSGAATVTLTADPVNAKRALITGTSAGVIAAVDGVAAANPYLPEIPAGRVVLAVVDIPATTTAIGVANITDKRVILHEVLTTRGDLLRRGATGNQRVALGAKGTVVMSDGVDPVYAEYNPYTIGPAVNLFGTNANFEAGSPTVLDQLAPTTSVRNDGFAYRGRWSYNVVTAATAGSGVLIESAALSLASGVTRRIAIGANVWASQQQNMWGRLIYTDTTYTDAAGLASSALTFLSGWTDMRGQIVSDATKTPSKLQFYCWNQAAVVSAVYIDNLFAYEV